MHPEKVSAWIKSKKKISPPEIDIDEFASSFMAWWIALQPGWRLADDGSFKYEAPKNEDWCVLHKGGSAGPPVYATLIYHIVATAQQSD